MTRHGAPGTYVPTRYDTVSGEKRALRTVTPQKSDMAWQFGVWATTSSSRWMTGYVITADRVDLTVLR